MAVSVGEPSKRSNMGTTVGTGRAMMDKSMANRRTGPSNKNLGPSRVNRPNPAPQVRGLSPGLKGPDKGAGGM